MIASEPTMTAKEWMARFTLALALSNTLSPAEHRHEVASMRATIADTQGEYIDLATFGTPDDAAATITEGRIRLLEHAQFTWAGLLSTVCIALGYMGLLTSIIVFIFSGWTLPVEKHVIAFLIGFVLCMIAGAAFLLKRLAGQIKRSWAALAICLILVVATAVVTTTLSHDIIITIPTIVLPIASAGLAWLGLTTYGDGPSPVNQADLTDGQWSARYAGLLRSRYGYSRVNAEKEAVELLTFATERGTNPAREFGDPIAMAAATGGPKKETITNLRMQLIRDVIMDVLLASFLIHFISEHNWVWVGIGVLALAGVTINITTGATKLWSHRKTSGEK